MTMKESQCFRNCITKTNNCYNAVLDNLNNSGVAFYREKNEQEFLKTHPKLAEAAKDPFARELDSKLGINLSSAKFNFSKY